MDRRATLARLSMLIAFGALAGVSTVQGAIAESRHDLSTNFEPYSNQPCAFCHTPHGANVLPDGPLWNRFVDTSAVFTLYSSPTLDSVPNQPTTSVSALCLGCHDGTAATAVVNGVSGSTMHDLVNAPGPGGTPDMTSYPNCERCHTDIYYGRPPKWLHRDLSDDHPVAIAYPDPSVDPEFHVPPDALNGWPGGPRLWRGRIECSTCHDVHDPTIVPFLRMSNVGSMLCLTCHIK